MIITLNGEKIKVKENITIRELLEKFNLKPEVVIVEKNGRIIQKERYKKEVIHKNDVLEVLRYMAGGQYSS